MDQTLAQQTPESDGTSSKQDHDVKQHQGYEKDQGGDDHHDDRQAKPPIPIEGITDESMTADLTVLYGSGQKLQLTPHKPCNPYGNSYYPWPRDVNIDDCSYTSESAKVSRIQAVFDYQPTPCKGDEQNQSLDETSKTQDLTLTVIKSLSGGLRAGPQVLLCSTEQHQRRDGMEDTIVAKIFDPLFFPWDTPHYEGPWTDTAFADMAFSNEAAAYKQLEEYDLHGDVHLAPQFHGAWTVTLTTTNSHKHFKNKRRSVGVVLMEYINGDSISDLCHKIDGILEPKVLTDKELKEHMDPTSEVRRSMVLELLLDGYSRQLFCGVEQRLLHPDNIIIQRREGGKYRVALLNYRHSVVDPLCKEPRNLYGGEDFPNPPHPVGVIYMWHLEHLIGWVPQAWLQDEKLLADWILRAFGTELNSDEYSSRPGLRVVTQDGPNIRESGQADAANSKQ